MNTLIEYMLMTGENINSMTLRLHIRIVSNKNKILSLF